MATKAFNLEKWIKEEEAGRASHDLDKMVAVYADDCIYEELALGKVMHGKEEIRAFFGEFITACPDDGSLKIKSPFASSNRMCMEFIMSGTVKGSFLGSQATGKTISIRGVHVCELRGNRVSRVFDYSDRASLMRQIGLLPPAMAVDPFVLPPECLSAYTVEEFLLLHLSSPFAPPPAVAGEGGPVARRIGYACEIGTAGSN